jgi:ubiquinone/menaquinone biosynthesis C-methylase UbiE
VPSEYDDELWGLVPEDPGPPPEHLVEFVDLLGRSEGAVLDLGCGDGRLTRHLRGRHIVGADVSRVALERARRRLEGSDIELVEVTAGAVLPFPDGAFDLVLCAETIEHVVDTETFLGEAHRVLAPGGEIAVTTPAHGRRTGVSMFMRGFARSFDPLSPHVRFFSRDSLRGLLEETGFDVTSIRTDERTLLARATKRESGR